jgi:hypothetical protein
MTQRFGGFAQILSGLDGGVAFEYDEAASMPRWCYRLGRSKWTS